MRNEKLKPRDLQRNYDSKADVYDLKRYHSPKGNYYMEAEAKILRNLSEDQKIICDVASGTGKNLLALCNDDNFVVGVDISYNMLTYAVEKCREKSIENFALVMADANHLPFKDKSFDVVLSTKFFHNVPMDTHTVFFAEMERLSRHIVIMELFNKLAWFGIPLLLKIKKMIQSRGTRNYFPWAYQRITGPWKRKTLYGFGVGLPGSDIIYRIAPVFFKSINYLMTYSPMKYIAPKLFFSVKVR